jgi:hypothetical protein
MNFISDLIFYNKFNRVIKNALWHLKEYKFKPLRKAEIEGFLDELDSTALPFIKEYPTNVWNEKNLIKGILDRPICKEDALALAEFDLAVAIDYAIYNVYVVFDEINVEYLAKHQAAHIITTLQIIKLIKEDDFSDFVINHVLMRLMFLHSNLMYEYKITTNYHKEKIKGYPVIEGSEDRLHFLTEKDRYRWELYGWEALWESDYKLPKLASLAYEKEKNDGFSNICNLIKDYKDKPRSRELAKINDGGQWHYGVTQSSYK